MLCTERLLSCSFGIPCSIFGSDFPHIIMWRSSSRSGMTLFGRFLEEGMDSADNDKTQIVLLSQLYDSFVIREAVTGVLIRRVSSLWWGRIKTSTPGRRGRIWIYYCEFWFGDVSLQHNIGHYHHRHRSGKEISIHMKSLGKFCLAHFCTK